MNLLKDNHRQVYSTGPVTPNVSHTTQRDTLALMYYDTDAVLEDRRCYDLNEFDATKLRSITNIIGRLPTSPSEFPEPYLHIPIQSNDHPTIPVIHISKISIKARKLNPIRPLQAPLGIPLLVPNEYSVVARTYE